MKIAIALAMCALLTACTTDSAPQPNPRPDARGEATVAFVTGNQLRFADGGGNVWGDLPFSSPYVPAVWSADGKRFAWLDESRLHIVTAATGVEKAQPCPCSGLGWLGDGFATVSADGTALLVFDRDGNPNRVPLHRSMPYASVGAGGRDQVAVVEPIPEDRAEYRGQSALTAVDGEGQVRLMIEEGSEVSFWGGLTSPDGSRIATIEAPSSGACYTSSSVYVLSNAGVNAKSDALSPDDQPFAEAVLRDGRDITGMTWAGAAVVVTFGPRATCHRLYPARFLTYQVDDGQLRFLRAGALQVGYGADGRSYAIELADDIDATTDEEIRGQLVVSRKGENGAKLADSVAAMWLTPAEQAAGKPKAQPRPDSRITTDDHGKPLTQGVLDLMGRISAALEDGDQAALSDLCAQCDAETMAMIRTPDGRDTLHRTLRTHPAQGSQSLTFPGLTETSCVDGRGTEGTCTRQQIHDIGLLGLSSQFETGTSVEKYSAPVEGSILFLLDEDGKPRWGGQSASAGYRHQVAGSEEPYYFFTSADLSYICGFDAKQALCQGGTTPVPPRPASCAEGPSWGGGLFVDASGKVDFVCAGGVMFYPDGREPNGEDVLPPGRTISALGFTCTAEPDGFRCVHDEDNHGFRISPSSNERF